MLGEAGNRIDQQQYVGHDANDYQKLISKAKPTRVTLPV